MLSPTDFGGNTHRIAWSACRQVAMVSGWVGEEGGWGFKVDGERVGEGRGGGKDFKSRCSAWESSGR